MSVKLELIFHSDFANAKEALAFAGSLLQEKGYVKDGFAQALLDREKHYPTGIPTAPPIALPHTDGDLVLSPCLLCVVNKKILSFKSLGGDDEEVLVQLLFVLALKDGNSHLKTLSVLIEKSQTGQLQNLLLQSTSEAEAMGVLVSQLKESV